MARKQRRGTAEREKRAVAILIMAIAVFWLLAFVTYRADGVEGILSGVLPADVCGAAGHRLAGFTIALLGLASGIALPALALVFGLTVWSGRRDWLSRITWGLAAWTLFLPVVLGLLDVGEGWGGAYGHTVSAGIEGLVGVAGAWILLIAAAVTAILILTDWSGGVFATAIGRVVRLADAARDALGRIRLPSLTLPTRSRTEAAPEPNAPRVVPTEAPAALKAEDPGRWEADEVDPSIVEPEFPVPAAVKPKAPKKKVRRDPDVRKRPASEFEPPPLTLLTPPPPPKQSVSRNELLDLSETLRRTLEEFGIRGRVGEVHPGPVITRYDFEPAPGIKVNQIISREDDIALALRTDRIRILSRIPGKAAVGIEIPNDEPDLIPFKDVVSSRVYQDPSGVLTLAPRKGRVGPTLRRPPRDDAASARGGDDGIRKVRLHQHDHREPPLSASSRGSETHSHRPQDARAHGLQPHPSPRASRRDRRQGGVQGAQLARSRDGATVQSSSPVARSETSRRITRSSFPTVSRFRRRGTRSRRSACRTSSASSTSSRIS